MPVERIKNDTAGIIAPPPLIYLAALSTGFILQTIGPLPLLLGEWFLPLGAGLITAGTLLAISGFSAMGRAHTKVNPYEPTTALVTDGPFRFTRNPLYLALTLLYVGIALMMKILWPVFLLPAALWIMRRGVIDREERYLEQKFGKTYLHYRQRVRRWI